MKVLLDSVILIDHFNGNERATRFLAESHADAAISVITRAEVLAGFAAGPARLAARLLDGYPNLPIDAATADLAAELRRAHGWKLPDAFQARSRDGTVSSSPLAIAAISRPRSSHSC